MNRRGQVIPDLSVAALFFIVTQICVSFGRLLELYYKILWCMNYHLFMLIPGVIHKASYLVGRSLLLIGHWSCAQGDWLPSVVIFFQ